MCHRKITMETRSIFIFLCLTVVLLASRCTRIFASDTFVCKKYARRSNADVVSLLSQKRVNVLEEKVAALEEQLNGMMDSSRQIPEVIKLQSAGLPRDCSEIYASGKVSDGVYRVSPDGRCPFDVYCDMANGGWTVIQRRRDGSIDFRRTWREYESGFGVLDGEFWLGLEKIHRLTQDGSQIYFTLEYANVSKENDWAHYESFIVQDFTSGYTMNVDAFGYKGSLNDLLSYHDGVMFSTFDRDNDMYSSSCSDEYGGGGGWWYNSCYRLGSLNAVYGKQGIGGIGYWELEFHYVRNVEVKIKPRDGMC